MRPVLKCWLRARLAKNAGRVEGLGMQLLQGLRRGLGV